MRKFIIKKNLQNGFYYQSAIDVDFLNKGMDYSDLPDKFIIFFCPFDYMERGLPMYTFKTSCTEDKTLNLADGITKIILNSKAAVNETNPQL